MDINSDIIIRNNESLLPPMCPLMFVNSFSLVHDLWVATHISHCPNNSNWHQWGTKRTNTRLVSFDQKIKDWQAGLRRGTSSNMTTMLHEQNETTVSSVSHLLFEIIQTACCWAMSTFSTHTQTKDCGPSCYMSALSPWLRSSDSFTDCRFWWLFQRETLSSFPKKK